MSFAGASGGSAAGEVVELETTPPGWPPAEGDEPTVGIGPYRLALRRLRRNKVALGFATLFVLLVLVCVLAPVYSHSIAHIAPNQENITGTVGGKDIVSPSGVPIGPTWTSHYLFGADENGRDLAVRLLYGGRTSLVIGAIATGIIIVFGTQIGRAHV